MALSLEGSPQDNPVSSLRMQSEAGQWTNIIIQPVKGCRCYVIERTVDNSGDASRVDVLLCSIITPKVGRAKNDVGDITAR